MSRVAKRPPRPRPRCLLGRLRGFHRAEGGQITMLTVFGAAILASMLGLVITTGDQVTQKIEMQNAVDAAALSGGVWIARGLNVTSGLNLIQTQLMAGAIVLNGLDAALAGIRDNLNRWIKRVRWCPTSFCSWFRWINKLFRGYADLLRLALRPFIDLLSACPPSGIGLFWVIAKVLEWVNRVVYEFGELVALLEVMDIGKVSGSIFITLIPGPSFHLEKFSEQLKMPLRREDVGRHCDPMENGSRARLHRGYHPLVGYKIGEGPFKLGRRRVKPIIGPFTWLPWVPASRIFDSAMDRERNAVCFGGKCSKFSPNPYLLNAAKDGLKYLAVARRESKTSPFWGERYQRSSQVYTYAQIEIYNAVNRHDPDTYTQDWRVRLAPASLVETGADLVGAFLGVDTVGAGNLKEVGNH